MIHPTIQNALSYAIHQHILKEQILSGAARDLYPKATAELALKQLEELDERIAKELNERIK